MHNGAEMTFKKGKDTFDIIKAIEKSGTKISKPKEVNRDKLVISSQPLHDNNNEDRDIKNLHTQLSDGYFNDLDIEGLFHKTTNSAIKKSKKIRTEPDDIDNFLDNLNDL